MISFDKRETDARERRYLIFELFSSPTQRHSSMIGVGVAAYPAGFWPPCIPNLYPRKQQLAGESREPTGALASTKRRGRGCNEESSKRTRAMGVRASGATERDKERESEIGRTCVRYDDTETIYLRKAVALKRRPTSDALTERAADSSGWSSHAAPRRRLRETIPRRAASESSGITD